LVIDIELISGRYDAAGAGDRDAAEWPPHPARVFCALVAGARSESDRDALRWLERQPPPVVQASPTARSDSRESYVVTNSVAKGGGSQFHPARTNALKSVHAAVPERSRIRVVWPGAEVETSTADVLDGLARRVPYLGRSTGVAVLAATVASQSESLSLPEGLEQFDQMPGGRQGVGLRVPYPGYLDLLIGQYEAGCPAWEVGKEVTYGRKDEDAQQIRPAATTPSVYTDVVVLRFVGLRPDGRLTALFTEALRRAVMSATADPLPDALHGHGADGRPHVAFLALPNVGNPHADGHLLGMAVAVPDLPEEERRAIVRGVLVGMRSTTEDSGTGQRTLRLRVPKIGDVDLAYQPGLVRPWGIRPERWRKGSDRWVSVTPVVLDRFPHKGAVEREITRSCLRLGLPEPQDVVVSTAPLVTGGIRMRPHDLPDQARGKLFRHVELRFGSAVAGPVILGAGRYLGFGLMAPLSAVDVTGAES
jgi:CRISPR-associated protein Csb2